MNGLNLMHDGPVMRGATILEVTVGSTAHGTAVNDGLEDLDLMQIVIERPEHILGFQQVDTNVWRTKPPGVRSEAGDVDLTCYGLRKYLHLALKGNPTILLALFVQNPRVITERGRDLQSLAPCIVSKRVYAPFRGYMHDQHKRLMGTLGQKNVTRPELVEKYGYDTKYAAHIVRLGLQGIELLRTGSITLPMPRFERELVTGVRTGQYRLGEVDTLIQDLTVRLEHAHETSPLHDRPEFGCVEAWMINAYREYWGPM